MAVNIDYVFAPGSPWALLGLEPFLALAARFGATVTPFPTPIIPENGAIPSKDCPEARRAYWLQDLKRWSAYRGLNLIIDNRPTLSDPTPIALTIIAAQLDSQDWAKATKVLQSALWQKAEDVGSADVRHRLLSDAGFDATHLLKREKDADVVRRWEDNRARAVRSGIFGSPTYIVEGQPYWGQDSLPFLELHLQGTPLLTN